MKSNHAKRRGEFAYKIINYETFLTTNELQIFIFYERISGDSAKNITRVGILQNRHGPRKNSRARCFSASTNSYCIETGCNRRSVT